MAVQASMLGAMDLERQVRLTNTPLPRTGLPSPSSTWTVSEPVMTSPCLSSGA